MRIFSRKCLLVPRQGPLPGPHGTVLGAHLTADLIAMLKNIVSVGMTEYIDPRSR